MNTQQEAAEREAFEAKYPMPSQCVWTGKGYAATGYNAWDAHKHCERWQGWIARATLSQQGGGAVAEPVAWRVNLNEGHDIPPSLFYFTKKPDGMDRFTKVPLYSAPPAPQEARAALTDEQIVEAYCAAPGIHQFVQAFKAGARFAEAAHKIAATAKGERG